jgi:serine/threonine protein kinase
LRIVRLAVNMARGPTVRYVKDYAVQELLGKGAFGCVYQAKKDTGETLFAMKELPLDMVSVYGGGSGEEPRDSDGEQSATLLEREVQILSTLQHPNIIRYYDSFQQGDFFYIVMELVEGATLLDHLNSLSEKRQSMAEPRIWQLFTQVWCSAVLAFHRQPLAALGARSSLRTLRFSSTSPSVAPVTRRCASRCGTSTRRSMWCTATSRRPTS